jgi:creatinine amidohydrolase/Fe(II)-dependent formamide hydrolase-like protein
MCDFRDVMFERMRPGRIAARRRVADVALLPVGNLEWHSAQNPVGLDSIKTHNVCCRAVRKMGGGAVLPTLLWGVPRDSFNVGIEGGGKGIAAILETEPSRWKGFASHGGMDVQSQWLFYQQLLRMVLEHTAGWGFRSIFICSGHGPFVHWIEPVAVAFSRASKMARAPVTTDWGNCFEPAGLVGDHAGKGETSAMMAIDEDLVDLKEVPQAPGIEKGSNADASAASAAYGEEWLDACATAVAAEAKWLSDNYPAMPARHSHHR